MNTGECMGGQACVMGVHARLICGHVRTRASGRGEMMCGWAGVVRLDGETVVVWA